MIRAHLSVSPVWQLIEMSRIPCVSVHRSLACLHHAVGGVRWKSSYRPAPLLTAAPVRALIDEQISIKGRFLPPHCPVTVCARMHSEDGDLWEACAHYNTNENGTVDSFEQGTRCYKLRKKNVETPFVVLISLLEGHVSPSEEQSTELAAVTTERWYMAPGVQRIDIRQDGIVGTLFLPPGPGPFPAMLDLWGLVGGLPEYRSALLSSRGYANLSLAYFAHKELPGPYNRISVKASYFKSAFQLLQNHRRVCADRVGIIASSYGVYQALRIATESCVNPSCLICINGAIGNSTKYTDVDGRTEKIESDQIHWSYDDQGYIIFKVMSLPENLVPESKAKLEHLGCPLMYIVGEDDLSLSSIENANAIEETLRAAGKSHLYTCLSYPGAGHMIEPPYSPNFRTTLWAIKPKKMFGLWGGQLAPHAAAQEDSWKKILDFMERNLRQ